MRWPWVLSVVLALGSPVTARPAASAPARDRGDFWREVIDPNGDQVRALLAKARDLMFRPDNAYTNDTAWAVDARTRFYVDAYHLLRHARRLAPEHVEVLSLLGRAADELGKTHQAIEALESSIRITGRGRAAPEVTGRLGAIYLRLGDPETAIRWLRLAEGPLAEPTAPALVDLAHALARRGEVAEAIDTLARSIPQRMLHQHYSHPMTLVTFALAVLYDRDEQQSAAFEVLDHMQVTLQEHYAAHVQNELAKLRFPYAEDLHYYRGLLYESLGHYTEARAEWAHYAMSGDPPYRARALDHIAAIDAQRRAAPGPRPQLQPQRGSAMLRRRLPRP